VLFWVSRLIDGKEDAIAVRFSAVEEMVEGGVLRGARDALGIGFQAEDCRFQAAEPVCGDGLGFDAYGAVGFAEIEEGSFSEPNLVCHMPRAGARRLRGR
jgi:hypothetical protein